MAPIADSQKITMRPSSASTAHVLYRWFAALTFSDVIVYATTTHVKMHCPRQMFLLAKAVFLSLSSQQAPCARLAPDRRDAYADDAEPKRPGVETVNPPADKPEQYQGQDNLSDPDY